MLALDETPPRTPLREPMALGEILRGVLGNEAMIDYELYCKLKDYHENRRLSVAQIACELGLDERTVSRWLNAGKFRQRGSVPRPSKLDPYKTLIIRWLETHPYTAVILPGILTSKTR